MKLWPGFTIVRLLYFIGTLRLVNVAVYIWETVYWLAPNSRWRIFWYRTRATMSCATSDLPQQGKSINRKKMNIFILISSSIYRVQNPEKQGISTVDEDIKKYTTLSYRSGSETVKSASAFGFSNLSELRRWSTCTLASPSRPRQISGLWAVFSTNFVSSVFHSERAPWRYRMATLPFRTVLSTRRWEERETAVRNVAKLYSRTFINWSGIC